MIDPQLLVTLRAYHTDENPHLAGSLIDHLVGVHDLLEGWGNAPYLCRAGLFHSVYGTQLFDIQSVPFEDRARVRGIIGEDAERVAYLFSVTHRGSFYGQLGKARPYLYDAVRRQFEPVTPAVLRDLIELEVANTVEFVPRTPLFAQEIELYQSRFEAAAQVISPAGLTAVRELLSDSWTLLRLGHLPAPREPVVR